MTKRQRRMRHGETGSVSFNMTPMIDCTFQLIIFFILASQIASRSLAHLTLPRPEHSQAIPSEQIDTPNRVVVNVISIADSEDAPEPDDVAYLGSADCYEIDGARIEIEEVDRLTEAIAVRRQASKAADFCVEVRADYRVSFADVQPVMLAAATAGVTNMNITALTTISD